MKDNPLAQAVREKTAQQPVDMSRMMQMIEEIHKAVVQQDIPDGPKGKIVTTQQSHS